MGSLSGPLVVFLVLAHSGADVGSPTAAEARSALHAGDVRFSLEAESRSSDARSDDDPAFTERVESLSVQPAVAFNLVEHLTLFCRAPIVRRTITYATAEGIGDTQRAAGLGDVELDAQLALPAPVMSGLGVSLSTGAILPSGQSAAQENGYRLDEHVQPGAGAPGFRASAGALLDRGSWALQAIVTGNLRLKNDIGYLYGPSLLWTLRGEYLPWSWLALGLALDGRVAGQDFHVNAIQRNTGGLLIAASPELRVQVGEDVSIELSASVPALARLNGEQRVGPRLAAAVRYTFR